MTGGKPHPHPLKAWLKARRLPIRHVARPLGITSISVSRWFSGARQMKLETRFAVESFTDGEVTRRAIEDWQALHLKRLSPAGTEQDGSAPAGGHYPSGGLPS